MSRERHRVVRSARSWPLACFVAAVACTLVTTASAGAAPLSEGGPVDLGLTPSSLTFSPRPGVAAVTNESGNSVSMFTVSSRGRMSVVSDRPTGLRPTSAVFSSSGDFLATANTGGDSVSLFFVASNGTLTPATTAATGDAPTVVALDAAASLMAVLNSGDNSVSMFSVSAAGGLEPKGPPAYLAAGVNGPAISLAVNPAGTSVAIGGRYGRVQMYSVSPSGALSPAGLPTDASIGGGDLAFDRDGRLLAVSDGTKSVDLLSVGSNGSLSPVGGPATAGSSPCKPAFSPDGKLLAIANSAGDSVSVFMVSSSGLSAAAGPLASTGARPASAAFSSDGAILATANADSTTASVFSVSPHGRLTPIGGTNRLAQLAAVTFNPVSDKLTALTFPHGFGVSDLTVETFGVSPVGDLVSESSQEFSGRPYFMAFAHDGHLFATGGYDGVVSMYTIASGGTFSPVWTTETSGERLAFGPEDNLLATVEYWDSAVSMFSVAETGELSPVGVPVRTGGAGANGLAFSPDGKFVAVGDIISDSLTMFSVTPSGVLTKLDKTVTGVDAVAVDFSPDGKFLAVADGATALSVFVYSVSADGTLTKVGTATTGIPAYDLVFSPSGRVLAVATNGQALLYHVDSTGAVTRMGSPTPAPLLIAGDPLVSFSRDGRFLSAMNGSGEFSVLPLEAPALDTWLTSHPAAVSGSAAAAFDFDANYPATFECQLDGGPFKACVAPHSVSGLAGGAHSLAVRARDPVGNAGPTDAWSWTVDTTPPTALELQAPADGAAGLPPAATFSWAPTSDAVAGLDRYELWLDGARIGEVLATSCAPSKCVFAPGAPLADGEHLWQVRALDKVGNVRSSVTRSFSVDAVPPASVVLDAPADNLVTVERRPVLTWAPSDDPGSGIERYDVTLDGHVIGSRLPSDQPSLRPGEDLAEGEHTWAVTARDKAGNERASRTQTFTVDVTEPRADFAAAPNPVLINREVTFDATGSRDAGGRIVRYEWDLDGNGSYETDGAGSPRLTRSFPAPAVVPVGLRVTDHAGQTDTNTGELRVLDSAGTSQLGTTITINRGAPATNDLKVTINPINPPRWANEIVVSNDAGFLAPTRLPLGKSVPWTLDPLGADRTTRIVYVRFARGPAISALAFDDIILDQLPPVITSAALRSSGGEPVLRVRARDSGLAGINGLQASNAPKRSSKRFRTQRIAAAPTQVKVRNLRAGNGGPIDTRRPIFVRVRDRAGNTSAWHRATRLGRR